ncbi:MAG: hypothetical protein PW789_00190 [Edaphobacter sp.]|uniref:hypothetical protein n=1 Tax=Edaphobacter sp. TaxID=1934404 RepID=UPI0023885422|nr:hypothetical protein [Edaphobacter sp.]MDE1175010.1 hypothetical protein [Edaphobacter sp.]
MSIATLLPERAARQQVAPAHSSLCAESAVSEIIHKIFIDTGDAGYQVVAFTSPGTKDDVSLLSALIAGRLGAMHGTVLAISAEGLLNASSDEFRDSDFTKVHDSTIWVSTKKPPTITAAQLSHTAMLRTMAILKLRFDFIIVDAGGCTTLDRTKELIAYIDGFVLVVAERQTSVRKIIQARQYLESNGARMIGAIYNEAPRERQTK